MTNFTNTCARSLARVSLEQAAKYIDHSKSLLDIAVMNMDADLRARFDTIYAAEFVDHGLVNKLNELAKHIEDVEQRMGSAR